MSFLRSLFTRTLPDLAPENPSSLKIHMNFAKAKETKVELDKKYADLCASEVLRVLQLPDKCLVVETFSKANGKVIGRRKLADFEKPFSQSEFGPQPGREDLKHKIWLADPDDTRIPPTSHLVTSRFKAQMGRTESAEQEPKVEREATFVLKHDLGAAEERKVHLFLTSQMIYFKYSHDKQRVTHIPLLLIDEIVREEASKLIFSIVSAGVRYFFLGSSADQVRQWTLAIQELRQKAQVRMAVQSAEQEIKASASRQASRLLHFRNLTKEEVFGSRDLRDVLLRHLRLKKGLPGVLSECLALLFDYFNALERADSSDLRKIEGLLDSRGFFQAVEELSETHTPLSRPNSFARDSSGSSRERPAVRESADFRERIEAVLARFFEVEGFLEFLFEQRGRGTPEAVSPSI